MRFISKLLFVAAATAPLASLATVFTFDLQGKGGFGLLPGNENFTVNGAAGSGGELGSGILFDDVTNVLTLNVGWGSGNSFTDLTGRVTGVHIHNSNTSSADTGTAAFLRNGGVVVNFPNINTYTVNGSGSFGSVTGFSVLSDANETSLFAGQLYFNVHTSLNSGGEIRGNLVNPTAIPEPSAFAAFAGLAGLALAASRRRRA